LKVLQNRISYAAFILRAQKSLYHRVEWLHIMIELSKIKCRTKILRGSKKEGTLHTQEILNKINVQFSTKIIR
jgi:hypothetical protein